MQQAALAFFSALALLLSYPVLGQSLPIPTGPVILSISGNIEHTNRAGGADFDREMLEAMAAHTVRTKTPWTDGVGRFEGPLGRSILEVVGANGRTMRVTALNDYAADVPISDFEDYNVILAMRLDGRTLSVREKGPLFVIYPFDDEPSLVNEKIFSRSVWQVKSIEIQ